MMKMRANRTMTAVLAMSALVCLSSGAVEAGTEGRISGLVLDPAEQPIEGVQVTVSAIGLDIHRRAQTNKKGKFTITVLNASRDFMIRLEKEGFQAVEEAINPTVGGTLKPVYKLLPGETIAPERLAELQRKDKAARVYNEGVQRFAAGDIDGAAELFQQSLEEDAQLGLAHLALARIFLARKDATAALAHAEKTNELVPDEELSQIVLFDALWDLEQFDRALPLLDQMVTSGKEPAKVAVRSYNAGAREVRTNNWDGAKQRFAEALELDASLVPAHLTLGQISLNQGDFEAAREHAMAYTEARPDDARGLSLLYQVHVAMGNDEAATAAFDRMSAADPEVVAQTFFEEGVTHFNAGRNDRAKSAFEKVLRAQPDHAQGHYFLGLVSASAGEISKAREYLSRFIELAPNDPEVPVARDMLAGLE